MHMNSAESSYINETMKVCNADYSVICQNSLHNLNTFTAKMCTINLDLELELAI